MIRLKRSSLVLLSVVAVALVLAMGYVIAAGYGKSSVLEDMIAGEAATRDTGASGSDEPETADVQPIASDRFAVELPEGWVSVAADGNERIAGGTYLYGWMYNEPDDGALEPDVRITVTDVLKDGASFDDVLTERAWDDADVAEIVAFMRAEAAEAFPDYSEEDVSVSTTYDQIGTALAARSMLQCLKPCYIEGAAQTNVTYFIDAPDRVYLFGVSTDTRSEAADFLNEADAVVRTFRLR